MGLKSLALSGHLRNIGYNCQHKYVWKGWLSGMFSFWKTFLFSKYVNLLIYSIIFYYLGKLFNSRSFRNDIIWQVFILLLILHPLFKRQIKD
ncbi:hypothetical protein Barb4_00645 [Bacteroidales bacterium Barb4]|nr:hypothetical protein Barb4_00645 [Bacteroidales bacterium Barb4]